METAAAARLVKRVEVPNPGGQAKPRIAPWKFAAGVLIHLSVPAYLLTLLVTFILYILEHGTAEGVFALMPPVSLWFVMLYAAVTIAVTGVAAMAGTIERARRSRQVARLGEEPAVRSRQELSHAIGLLGTMIEDPTIESALHAIAEAAWQHDDDRYQHVSRDLEKAAGTYATAYASAGEVQRLEVSRLTAETLRHFAQKLDDLARETGMTATRNAQTMAGYIASKYGDDLDSVR